MNRAQGAVLLTGATGFVGMEVLARYLERGDRPVYTLIRAESDRAAQERLDAVLATLFGPRVPGRHAERVRAVAGELTAPHLGLNRTRREDLARQVTTIVHSAASVSFTLPLEDARQINVGGTRRMLEFAELARELGGLGRYGHVSTAYVAGTHAGRFAESDLDVGQRFNNSYEQSKFEAEQLVRAQPELPFTILRPSIVVGDRRSGWTAAFNVLYWPLRALARGLFEAIPASPSAPLDVVSVDYVADAIYELCEARDGIGETYHLAAGAQASTMGEVAQLASGYFRRPAPKMLPPAEFASLSPTVAQGSAFETGSAYFPYFSINAVFDDAATRARLEPAGIRVSPLRDYMDRLLDYATRSRWGKRPIARSQAQPV
ncbi:MAG: SDR family oxidoreductase [Solirubrobacterales bacterium]|nr:SDR family oxidoreductase [Solirubrobacterales bacterium]